MEGQNRVYRQQDKMTVDTKYDYMKKISNVNGNQKGEFEDVMEKVINSRCERERVCFQLDNVIGID